MCGERNKIASHRIQTVGDLRAALLKFPDAAQIMIEDADTDWFLPIDWVAMSDDERPGVVFIAGDYHRENPE